MAEYEYSIGKVVAAGDLVTVQRGTRYVNMVYSGKDIDWKTNYKAYVAFNLSNDENEGFLYWDVDGEKLSNSTLIEEGIDKDTYAFEHLSADLTVEYDPCVEDLVSKTYVLSHEVYYALNSVNDPAEFKSPIEHTLIQNPFKYDKHRFANWSKTNIYEVVEKFNPGEIHTIYDSIKLSAEWIQQYNFKLLKCDNGSVFIQEITDEDNNIQQKADDGMYDVNTRIQTYANPALHYHLSTWCISAGNDYIEPNSDNTEILMTYLTSDTTVNAKFALDQHKLHVAVTPFEYGTVNVQMNSTNTVVISKTDFDASYGTSITLGAAYEQGYRFISWQGDIAGSNMQTTNTTFNLENDTSLTAVFDIEKYNLQIAVTPINSGNVTVKLANKSGSINDSVFFAKNYTAEYKALLEVFANPMNNYRFVEWKGNVVFDSSTNISLNDSTTLTGDAQLTAVFELIPVVQTAIQTEDGSIPINIQVAAQEEINTVTVPLPEPKPSDYITKNLYTVTCGCTPAYAGTVEYDKSTDMHKNNTYVKNESVTFTAQPIKGYEFIGWYDSAGNPIDNDYGEYIRINKNKLSIIRVRQNYAFTAKFNCYIVDNEKTPIIDYQDNGIDYSGSNLDVDLL